MAEKYVSEDLDYNTLLTLLKEKTKEANNSQRKISKLEERYISKHRENSELSNDRELVISFIQSMLEVSLPKEPGRIKGEDLENAWARKESEQKRLIRSLTNNASEELQKTRSEIKALREELSLKTEKIKDFESLEEDYEVLSTQNKETKVELEFIEKEIDRLRVENARLKAQQEHNNSLKTNALIAALDLQPSNEEVEKLQKMLVKANERISVLESENQEMREANDSKYEIHTSVDELVLLKSKHENKIEELSNSLKNLQDEFQEHRKKAQKMLLDKDADLQRVRNKLQALEKGNENEEIIQLRMKIMEIERIQNKESVNMEYLKNIVIRFMDYMYSGNIKEANAICTAIFTVLEFSEEEMKVVKSAQEASYIYNTVSNLFYTKSPGVGVNHNRLHTNELKKRSFNNR